MKILPVGSVCTVANIMEKKPALQKGNAASRVTYSPTPLNLHKNHAVISFGRRWEEHKSWGVAQNPDSTTNFKFYTFPDAKKVYVEVLEGPQKREAIDKVWERDLLVERGEHDADDTSKAVTHIDSIDGKSKVFELERKEDLGGSYFQKWNVEGLKTGDYYRFIIVDKNNVIESVKDPYSKEQRGILSWSTIHNPDNYQWGDDKWMSGKDPRRVSRQSNSGLTPVGALRIMELNVATATPEGTFRALLDRGIIEKIAEKGIANAIEYMPFEDCHSKQWGYDGVDKLAINERLGTADEAKEVIDRTHQCGLNAIIDMVPNHIGQDGNLLSKTGPYERTEPDPENPGKMKVIENPAGPMINYQGPGNRYVRDWMANAALHWANEYHVDGLRLDMTKPIYMGSDFALQQINAEMNEHFPHVFMIAEDGREASEGRDRVTAPIDQRNGHEQVIGKIDSQIERQTIDDPLLMGFDADWDFGFFHALKEMLHNPGGASIQDLSNAIADSGKRVAYPISHDEQGNWDGTSGVVKYAATKLNLLNKIPEGNDAERGQNAAAATQWLLELHATDGLRKKPDSSLRADLRSKFGVEDSVAKEDVEEAYNWAIDRAKLGMGTVWTTPGPKMFFQGYENGSLNLFKFFRDFNSGPEPGTHKEKGYDTSTAKALADSLPDRIDYTGKVADTMDKVEQYFIDLSKLVDDNPALQDGYIVRGSTEVHQGDSKVLGIHSKNKKGNSEIFSIMNFYDNSYRSGNAYGIKFPEGKWQEVLSSDERKYAGEGRYTNSGRTVTSDGKFNSRINLGGSGVSVWKRVA